MYFCLNIATNINFLNCTCTSMHCPLKQNPYKGTVFDPVFLPQLRKKEVVTLFLLLPPENHSPPPKKGEREEEMGSCWGNFFGSHLGFPFLAPRNGFFRPLFLFFLGGLFCIFPCQVSSICIAVQYEERD